MAARGGSRGGAKGGSTGVVDSVQQGLGAYFFRSSPDWQSGLAAIAGTAMRVIVALLVIHHGTEHTAEGSIFPGSNPKAVEGFAKNVVAPYMSWLPILDSVGWTIVRDWTEVVCGFLMVFGLFTRPAALGMCFTMVLATYFHIEKTGWQGFPFGHVPAHTYEFELSLANTMVFAFFAVAGAGPISLDNVLTSFVWKDDGPKDGAPSDDVPKDASA
jgi:putative oxidoreductase